MSSKSSIYPPPFPRYSLPHPHPPRPPHRASYSFGLGSVVIILRLGDQIWTSRYPFFEKSTANFSQIFLPQFQFRRFYRPTRNPDVCYAFYVHFYPINTPSTPSTPSTHTKRPPKSNLANPRPKTSVATSGSTQNGRRVFLPPNDRLHPINTHIPRLHVWE